MSRRIVTTGYQSTGTTVVDGFFDRVLKYIPADINGAWVAVTGLIKTAGNDVPQSGVYWVCFIVGIIITGVWTHIQTRGSRTQTIVSTLAFFVWVFALGGTWIRDSLPWYRDLYGSLLLIGYTLAVGMIIPKDPPPATNNASPAAH